MRCVICWEKNSPFTTVHGRKVCFDCVDLILDLFEWRQ